MTSRWVWLPQIRAGLVSGDVALGLAEAEVTPVGRRRGACGSGPFPAAPSPNRTGSSASGSPAAVTCRSRLASACRVHAGFPSPFRRSALRIPPSSGILNRLIPFALRAAFPPSLAGRYSRDYYGASVTRGLASPQVIPRSSLSYVLARPRPPTHLLGYPRWASPRHWRCARTQRHAGAVPGTGFMRLSGGAKVYPGWRLGFRQSGFSHIARVPSARRPYASARPLVSWHALVPFTFQIQVSHQTQEYPPNPSRLHREYDRAPRGAGWFLVWYWLAWAS